MDYFQLQDFIKKTNPGKSVSFEFDEKCIRHIECIYTEGNLHPINHVQHEQCKVTIEGSDPVYVPIKPHRELISAERLKQKIPSDGIHVYPKE